MDEVGFQLSYLAFLSKIIRGGGTGVVVLGVVVLIAICLSIPGRFSSKIQVSSPREMNGNTTSILPPFTNQVEVVFSLPSILTFTRESLSNSNLAFPPASSQIPM